MQNSINQVSVVNNIEISVILDLEWESMKSICMEIEKIGKNIKIQMDFPRKVVNNSD